MKTQRWRREKRKKWSWLKGAVPEGLWLEVFSWKEKIKVKKVRQFFWGEASQLRVPKSFRDKVV